IKDNYLRFWFAYVYPNKSFIESGQTRMVMNKIRKSLISGHVAYVYEDVCREAMWELNADDAWDFHFTKLGRYWDANTEIDIAALDPEGNNLILGECKYWQEPVGINVLSDLEKKAESVSWQKNNRTVWYVLFSGSGFTPELIELAKSRKDVMLVDDSDA
ncbi:MAG: ATP-binding protein, partial [Clostridia bacterium]|nr:ATP-binding protein [Clostridia bacterium]